MYNPRPLTLCFLIVCLLVVLYPLTTVASRPQDAPLLRLSTLLHPFAPVTTRVSVWSDGVEGDGASADADISANSQWIVFESTAMNGTPPGIGLSQVYLHDRLLGNTVLLSSSLSGEVGSGTSEHAAISDDGTVIAFRSGAGDLVEDDSNGTFDIFVYGGGNTRLERISGRADGTEAQRDADAPALSADGRYVVFESQDALLPIDRNGVRDVYRKDRQTGTLELVSMIYTGGAAGTGASREPTISRDGRYVAFISSANNLVPNDQGQGYQTYWRDMTTGATIRLSVGTGGADPTGGDCATPAIAADSRHVSFSCAATNLVPNDTNGVADIFVATVTLTTPPTLESLTRLTTTTDGTEPNGASTAPFYAPNDSALAFTSDATNWVEGDTNGVSDVFLWRNDIVERYSIANDGGESNSASVSVGVAKNGTVLFVSDASNLVSTDMNGVSDIFVRGEPLQAILLYLPLTQR